MSADLLARLIAAGTPADLVGEVAMALASARAEADALAARRQRDAARQQDRRDRLRAASVSRDVKPCHVTSRDIADETPSPDKSPPDPQKLTPTPQAHGEGAPTREAPGRAWACPDGVDPGHWRDFRANRRRKRLTDTETAYAAQLRAIERYATAEWPPGRLVRHAAEMGWGKIVDPTEIEGHRNGKRPANDYRSRRGGNGMLDAVLDAEYASRAGPGH